MKYMHLPGGKFHPLRLACFISSTRTTDSRFSCLPATIFDKPSMLDFRNSIYPAHATKPRHPPHSTHVIRQTAIVEGEGTANGRRDNVPHTFLSRIFTAPGMVFLR